MIDRNLGQAVKNPVSATKKRLHLIKINLKIINRLRIYLDAVFQNFRKNIVTYT